MEIEKKYLTKKVHFSLEGFKKAEISQCYISTEPVIRLRNHSGKYMLTVKGDGLISREELELNITKEQYERLIKKSETSIVIKTRYYIPLKCGLTAELDVYHSQLDGLITTEVEFSSLEEMETFAPPRWFGIDISDNKMYKNSYLAIHGRPAYK